MCKLICSPNFSGFGQLKLNMSATILTVCYTMSNKVMKRKAKLSPVHREALKALIKLYRGNGFVRSRDIAEILDKNPASVKRAMMTLQALGLVESSRGNGGGFRPTPRAFEALSVKQSKTAEKTVSIPVIVNGKPSNTSAEEVKLLLDCALAKVRITGDVPSPGDQITVGSVPLGLVIRGEVTGSHDDWVIVELRDTFCIPEISVEEVIEPVRAVNAEDSVEEIGGFRCCVLVKRNGRTTGILTAYHIAKAISENKLTSVGEIADSRIVRIDRDTTVKEAIRLMKLENTDVLLVVHSGKYLGAVTTRGILKVLEV